MPLHDIIRYLEDKKIGILGFGLEGQSTYRFLRRLFSDKEIGIADKDPTRMKSYFSEPENVCLFYNEGYLEGLHNFNPSLVFKSPGIPLKQIDSRFSGKILDSQAGLFIRFFKNRVIGVTGTKGKSTTSSLICEALRASGTDAVAVGNIGKPVFDLIIEDQPDRLYVFELSSHMLETLRESPKYAVLLNIYEEHLDHYRSFSDYAEAKLNILRFQNSDDISVISRNVLDYVKENIPGEGKTYIFDEREHPQYDGIFQRNGRIMLKEDGAVIDICGTDLKRKLMGSHNLSNIMACLVVLKLTGVKNIENAFKAVADFNGLEHRLEFVGEFKGIRFFDDSISTIPQATIYAVEAVPDVETLIIGGMDRGLDYSVLLNFLGSGRVKNVICLPDTGHQIHRMMQTEKQEIPVFIDVDDMKSAVLAAYRLTGQGKACVMSPAAASYGFYKNFEERGNIYKELVRAFS